MFLFFIWYLIKGSAYATAYVHFILFHYAPFTTITTSFLNYIRVLGRDRNLGSLSCPKGQEKQLNLSMQVVQDHGQQPQMHLPLPPNSIVRIPEGKEELLFWSLGN